MAFDARKNFAISTVATAPIPATSGVTVIVATEQGELFPAAPFNAVIWPIGTNPSSTNAEVVRVTVKVTDTLTVTRAQEGSSARTVIVGDQIMAGLTDKTLADIESGIPVKAAGTDLDALTDDAEFITSKAVHDGHNVPHAAVDTSGKVLVSNGTDWVASTPTFPNASATTRKIIVSDGTNWTASTETYPIATTSGNTLISDGTNWTSAKVANANLSTTAGDVGGAWLAWTPTLSGRLNDAKWTKACKYTQIGKTIYFRLYLVSNNATPMDGGATDAIFSLPVTSVSIAAQVPVIGQAGFLDPGTARYTGWVEYNSTTTARVRYIDTAAVTASGGDNSITSTLPITWTTSDEIYCQGTYEAA
jgi:hypothetical protein